jgi:DNA integrity scanning protein DisA with diadenylate cyclase activity
VLTLAVELAREGREGRRVGAIFVVGDAAAVMQRSKSLILDPLAGHDESARHIDNLNMRETIKELAQLDGAFVVRDDGVVISACRYLNASSQGIDLPLGLGSRHMAAASITRETGAVAVVVSESAVVRIFDEGQLVAEIMPDGWDAGAIRSKIPAPHVEKRHANLRVFRVRAHKM